MKSIGNRRVSQIRKFAVRSASAERENQRNQARSGAGLGACACACVRALVAVLALTPFPRIGETLAFFRQFSFAVAVSLGGVSLGGGRSGAGLGACACACVRAVVAVLALTPAPRVGEPPAFFRQFSFAVAVSLGGVSLGGAVLCVPGWPRQFGAAKGAIMAFFT
jgi:hypothetical protein